MNEKRIVNYLVLEGFVCSGKHNGSTSLIAISNPALGSVQDPVIAAVFGLSRGSAGVRSIAWLR